MHIASQLLLACSATGLVLGPLYTPQHTQRCQPAMQQQDRKKGFDAEKLGGKRDADGYLLETELTGWTELKKSTALGATVTEWKDLPPKAQQLIDAVKAGDVEFEETMAAIEEGYDVTEVSFDVGEQKNSAGTNMGSGKILSFGTLAGLSVEETCKLFGKFYRDDVLGNPDGDDHQNIRNFMKTGWEGVTFPWGLVLSPKAAFNMEAGDLSTSTDQVADALAASEQISADDDWDPDSEIWIP
jgi:hypothetical protein